MLAGAVIRGGTDSSWESLALLDAGAAAGSSDAVRFATRESRARSSGWDRDPALSIAVVQDRGSPTFAERRLGLASGRFLLYIRYSLDLEYTNRAETLTHALLLPGSQLSASKMQTGHQQTTEATA